MRENKAVTVLKTLDPDEFKNFQRFIDSPYHNRSSDAKKLFTAIKKFYPKFENEKMKTAALLRKLYPGQKTADVRLRKAYSDLFTVAEKYMLQLEWEQNHPDAEKYLVSAMSYRKLFPLAGKTLEPLLKKFSEPYALSRNYFLNKYALHNLERTISKNLGGYRADKKVCEALSEDSVLFTVTTLMENFCNIMVTNSDIMSDNANAALEYLKCINLDELVRYFERSKSPFCFYLSIYYDLYKLYTEGDIESKIDPLLHKIQLNSDKYDIVTLSNLYNIMEAIAIRSKNFSETGRNRLRFKLAQKRISTGRYKNENSGMEEASFIGIITSAANCGEHKWMKSFIDEYSGHIRSPFRMEIGLYADAFLKVYLGDFEGALTALSKITRRVDRLKYHTKAVTLVAFYELGYIEQALSGVDAYKTALSREKNMTKKNMDIRSSFIRFYEKLLKNRLGKSPDSLQKLKDEIASAEETLHKYWLLEKAEELDIKADYLE